MRDKLDPLIAERAPWLFRKGQHIQTARRALNFLLGYDKTVALGRQLELKSPPEIMAHMGAMVARDLDVSGLENLPRQGAALVVANHPTGIADGIILYHLLSPMRPDVFIFANSDIMRVLPQMERLIAPVEWRSEKRSISKTRETMTYTRRAIEAGKLGIIFPSGRLAKRRGLRLHEREWMASAATIARKFNLRVIPVNIRARNSALFYLFDIFHPTLRDITLFHETLNKHRQPYRVTIGEPISPASLPAQSDLAIEILRKETLALGGPDGPTVSLINSSHRPSWA
ncbi:MAG: lysophospholipid acyltransferase family protein [Pseudomonadota bacterium]